MFKLHRALATRRENFEPVALRLAGGTNDNGRLSRIKNHGPSNYTRSSSVFNFISLQVLLHWQKHKVVQKKMTRINTNETTLTTDKERKRIR